MLHSPANVATTDVKQTTRKNSLNLNKLLLCFAKILADCNLNLFNAFVVMDTFQSLKAVLQ